MLSPSSSPYKKIHLSNLLNFLTVYFSFRLHLGLTWDRSLRTNVVVYYMRCFTNYVILPKVCCIFTNCCLLISFLLNNSCIFFRWITRAQIELHPISLLINLFPRKQMNEHFWLVYFNTFLSNIKLPIHVIWQKKMLIRITSMFIAKLFFSWIYHVWKEISCVLKYLDVYACKLK